MTDEANEKLINNAEYQRRKAMSRDERTFISRDLVAKNHFEQMSRDNPKATYDESHRKASEIAEKQLRKEQEKK